MSRRNASDDELEAAEATPQIEWEKCNRRLFKWIGEVQTQQFARDLLNIPMAHDQVRSISTVFRRF